MAKHSFRSFEILRQRETYNAVWRKSKKPVTSKRIYEVYFHESDSSENESESHQFRIFCSTCVPH